MAELEALGLEAQVRMATADPGAVVDVAKEQGVIRGLQLAQDAIEALRKENDDRDEE